MSTKWFSLFLLISVAACGTSNNVGDELLSESSSLAGTWGGTWRSNGGLGGTITFSITQTGNALSGTAAVTNSGCLEAAAIDGTVNGDDVMIDITSGDTRATVHLTVTGPDQVDGTYDAVSAGSCSGDTGIIDATR